MKRDPGYRMRAVLAIVVGLAVTRQAAWSDVLALAGRPITVGLTITALEDGRLHYTLPDGSAVSQPIEQIRYIQITGWDRFNEAERAGHDNRFLAAAEAYESALAELAFTRHSDQGRLQGTLDRKLLVQCRLVQVYDAMGRFDEAVAVYLDVIERLEAALDTLRPIRMPAEGSTFLPSAVRSVREAIDRHAGTPVAQSLADWLVSWPTHPDISDERPPAAATARDDRRREDRPREDDAVVPGELVQARLTRAADRVREGQWEDALTKLASLQDSSAGALRPEVFYWQGRCWAEKAAAMEAAGGAGESVEAAARARRRAGLAFMRVIIHYPYHPRAAESLWRAGELCISDGRADLAAGLWSELIRAYPSAEPWRQKAAEQLEALGTTDLAARSAAG